MYTIKRCRNEWKYCCTVNDAKIISNRLTALLDKDSYGNDGKYEVHSLYFDDHKDSATRENDAGVSKRFKYRIRYYNEQYQMMRLECKEKTGGLCYKESCLITPEDYRKILEGAVEELFWQTEDPLLQKFCIRCMTRKLEPKAIIDYERTAYVEESTNIRITLDNNISVSNDFSNFMDGDYMRYPIQEKEQSVLEVKFDDILPGYIRHMVTNRHLIQTAFSKYCLGRKKLQSMGR
ncbi:MAG: polyphosphate polymerase domain-containing protein [Bacteroidales bacterium]|nr:polyphosphate polymerase domain-containing protein [Bacteroidales bacterium]MCM1414704.1 polyphosphate polymerase domain-containing protein [bacterium]MCM1422513.1 polyphosphate polymerase domain-containing protein [bacterium]